MKTTKFRIFKKAITLLLCLALLGNFLTVAISAMAYKVKIEFKIAELNEDNKEYTGPGFDTDGVGFTVYYRGDDDTLKTVAYSITGTESVNEETGYQYAEVSCYGMPVYVEYYSEGTALESNENLWSMRLVYLNDVKIWEGEIYAIAKGVSSYIAKLDLSNGTITKESGNEVLGQWISTTTTWYINPVSQTSSAHIFQKDLNFTVEKGTVNEEVWVYFADQFQSHLDSIQMEKVIKDGLVTITCNFSESSAGFAFDTWYDHQSVIDCVTDSDSISVTVKWAHYSYIDLKLIIYPEAIGEEWDEQTLTFTAKYYDLQMDSEVEFEVPEKITITDSKVTYTFDANTGVYANTGENNTITSVAKPYYNTVGEYPIPTKAGYSFNGYYLTKDENMDDTIGPDSEKLTDSTIMKENCTWYASWSKNEYGATFSYLDETGKRVYKEVAYKFGEEYAPPEIPTEVNYKNELIFIFTGWSPEFTGTHIMEDANVFYEAQYRTEPYIDYPELNENNYYEIETADHLILFAEILKSDSSNANAILVNDIDFTDKEWTPIADYSGTFDGNYKTITGLHCVSDNGNSGLFSNVTSGVVKNLHITNSYFEGTENAGSIAGSFSGNIFNCYVDNVTVSANQSGTLVGTFDGGLMTNCYSYSGSLADSCTNTIINKCYYLSETETEDGGKTAEQFASGEVAYLLQQGNTEQVWGQDNNQAGATPIFDSTGLYKVVTVGETGNYSVANIGDTNGDGTVDVTDYQAIVNTVVLGSHTQSETESYNEIVKYDLNGDGYVDALDAQLMNLVINDMANVDVYAVGDYDLNGKTFEETDIKAIKHAIENPAVLSTSEKYACDINADGKVSKDDLTFLEAIHGEIEEVAHIFVGNKCKICGFNNLNIADIAKTVYFNDNDNKLDLSTLFTLPDGAGNVTYELVSGSGNLDGSTLNIVLQGTEKIKVTVAETETCSGDEFEITVTVEAPKGSGSFDGEWVTIGF